MKVLYKNEDDVLAVTQVTKAAYLPEDEVLQICGPEEDFGVKVTYKEAKQVILALYQDGHADVTAYPYCEVDFYEEEEEDMEDEEDDFMSDILNSVDGIRF